MVVDIHAKATDGLSADRVGGVPEGADSAKGIAWPDQAEHDLMAFWRQLGQLHSPACQDEERLCLIAFAEEELTGLERFRVRQTDDPHERVCG
jgi:hypothetical protein